ncbi:MAG: hypothetical protein D6723_07920 [Acidobacteria bacterium]|nr:MAG: hypothetical protein D6723_07920 [Acidobacteriota bacterium]
MPTRWRKPSLWIYLIAGLTVMSGLGLSSPADYPVAGDSWRVIIPAYGPEETSLAEKYLRAGDIVVLHPPKPELRASGLPQQPEYWIRKAEALKARHPKIEVLFNFDSIQELREWAPKLPAAVDWISYDYERWQFTPEYKPDEAHTRRLFREARRIAHKHGKRLFLTPIPFFNRRIVERARRVGAFPKDVPPWDFGKLARIGDAFNAQLQFSLREIDHLTSTLRAMVAERRKEAPKTLFFVQVGPGPRKGRYTDDELKRAIDVIKRSGVDGVVVWFGPGMSDWGEKVLRMMRATP